MNSIRSRRVTPLLLLALATACSSVPPPPTVREPASREGGNGGPRGGGDVVAGEYMEIERIVMAKIEVWKRQGKIDLRDADLAKLRKVMLPIDPKDPTVGHVVTSEEHVCMTEEKTPAGDCVRATDERDVIKQPFAAPKRIRVGRVRWAGLKADPQAKEILVLHELLGLALSVPGREFVDEAFERTYRTLLANQKEWNLLMHAHLDYLRRIRLYDEMLETVDLGHFKTALNSFKRNNRDYQECVGASDATAARVRTDRRRGRSSETSRDAYRICMDSLNALYPTLVEDATPQIQAHANGLREKVVGVVQEYEAWLGRIGDTRWRAYFIERTQAYVTRRNVAFQRFNGNTISPFSGAHGSELDSIIANTLNPIMDRYCPRESKPDYRKVVVCNVENGLAVANDFFRGILGKVVDELVAGHEQAVTDSISRVDPL